MSAVEAREKAQLLATQDNAITSDPIFLVQEKKRLYGVDPSYCETLAYVNGEDDDPVTQAEHPERFARFEEGVFDEDEDGSEDMWTLTGYIDRWEYVQPFLTREAAEDFRKREAHNHGETRVYVDSGCRNPEWQWLREHVATCAATLIAAQDGVLELVAGRLDARAAELRQSADSEPLRGFIADLEAARELDARAAELRSLTSRASPGGSGV